MRNMDRCLISEALSHVAYISRENPNLGLSFVAGCGPLDSVAHLISLSALCPL